MRVLPNLTSLRFFLAFFVVIFHVPQFCKNQGMPFLDSWSIFHKGSEAVYMFFSLSGFLIIRQLYLEKKETDSIRLNDFYIRRILRIFPLYYLVLFFGLLYYQIILPWAGYDIENNYNLSEGILLSVFFMPNVFKELYHPGGIIEVLWSIGIEEQFYLLIAPLFLLIKSKYTVKFLVAFTLIYFALFFSDLSPQLQIFNMYFFYFSSAGLFSILILNKNFSKKLINIASVLFLGLLIVYFTTSIFSAGLEIEVYHFISMLLFGISLSLLSQQPLKVLENSLFNYLGKISYGIYMFHCIMIQVAGFLYLKVLKGLGLSNMAFPLFFNATVLLLTIVAAGISYRYFETFFLKQKHHFSSRKERRLI